MEQPRQSVLIQVSEAQARDTELPVIRPSSRHSRR